NSVASEIPGILPTVHPVALHIVQSIALDDGVGGCQVNRMARREARPRIAGAASVDVVSLDKVLCVMEDQATRGTRGIVLSKDFHVLDRVAVTADVHGVISCSVTTVDL